MPAMTLGETITTQVEVSIVAKVSCGLHFPYIGFSCYGEMFPEDEVPERELREGVEELIAGLKKAKEQGVCEAMTEVKNRAEAAGVQFI